MFLLVIPDGLRNIDPKKVSLSPAWTARNTNAVYVLDFEDVRPVLRTQNVGLERKRLLFRVDGGDNCFLGLCREGIWSEEEAIRIGRDAGKELKATAPAEIFDFEQKVFANLQS